MSLKRVRGRLNDCRQRNTLRRMRWPGNGFNAGTLRRCNNQQTPSPGYARSHRKDRQTGKPRSPRALISRRSLRLGFVSAPTPSSVFFSFFFQFLSGEFLSFFFFCISRLLHPSPSEIDDCFSWIFDFLSSGPSASGEFFLYFLESRVLHGNTTAEREEEVIANLLGRKWEKRMWEGKML